MRELTVRIRFTRHSLGNQKSKQQGGVFLMQRGPSGSVIFMPTWHEANMRYAAKLLGRHQDEVYKIRWDINVDCVMRGRQWFRRYYSCGKQTVKQRYCRHEAFLPGQVIGLNCVVPSSISEDDLWQLMNIAGSYRGLSPYEPTKYGFFEVESIRPRRPLVVPGDEEPLETERAK